MVVLTSEESDLLRIWNPRFFFMTEIIAIVNNCENSMQGWICSFLGKSFV